MLEVRDNLEEILEFVATLSEISKIIHLITYTPLTAVINRILVII